jgi:hypothetical protein
MVKHRSHVARARKKTKLREWFYPTMGFKRLALYYKHRMGRMSGSAEAIARGFATGVAVNFTPFIGLHTALSVGLCWLTRASLVSMLLGVVLLGNPWMLGLCLLASYGLGKWMIGEMGEIGKIMDVPPVFTFSDILHHPMEWFFPMLLGSVPLTAASGLVSYYLALHLVRRYKKIRLARIYARHQK